MCKNHLILYIFLLIILFRQKEKRTINSKERKKVLSLEKKILGSLCEWLVHERLKA